MTSASGRYGVVIGGGGIAGLTLACALADALGSEVRIAVVDRAQFAGPARRRDGRAFALSAGSKNMLARLGVWPALAEEAQPVTAVDITDSSLEDAFRPVLVSYDNRVDGEPATWIVENDRLLEALVAAASSRPGVELVGGTEVEAFARDEHGVDVTLAGGGLLRAALLIAADGRNSRLREAAGIQRRALALSADRHRDDRAPRQAPRRPGRAAFSALGTLRPVAAHRQPHLHHLDGSRRGAGARSSRSTMRRSWRRWRSASIGGWAALRSRARAAPGRSTCTLPARWWPIVSRCSATRRMACTRSPVRASIWGFAMSPRWPRWWSMRRGSASTSARSPCSSATSAGGGSNSALSAAAFDSLNRLFSNDLTPLRTLRDFGLGLVERMPGLKQFFVAEAAGLTGEVPRLLRGDPT